MLSGMDCWGSHFQKHEASQKIPALSEVKTVAGTDEKLWVLLKNGSCHSVLTLGENESRAIASGVVDLFAGDSQVFTLHDDGKMYQWPNEEERNIPVPFPLPNKKKVVQAACGKFHLFLLTKYGEVYTQGDNTYGQLGLGKIDSANVSKLEMIQSLKGLPISQIAAGYFSSFCVSISGRAFAWGQNDFGQLGLKDGKTKEISPQLIEFSVKHAVAFISAGEHHTAILTKDGGLFTCGKNSCGQLGHDDISKIQTIPRKVTELEDSVVTTVSCGQNHTVTYVPQCGQVFVFGDNSEGQLGIPEDSKLISSPVMLGGPWCDNQHINKVNVYALGNNTVVLYSESDEKGLNVDDGLVPQHRQIAKIDERLCEKITGLDECSPEYEQELLELEPLLRSQSCLCSSFCVDDMKSITEEFLGIDFNMARKLLAKLCNHSDICDLIVSSLQYGIVANLPNDSADFEAMKIYVILPVIVKSILDLCNGNSDLESLQIPLRCWDNVLLCFMEKALWLAESKLMLLLRVVDKDYFVMTLKLYKALIEQVLFGKMNTKIEESRLRYPVKMLQILFDINAERKIVNYKEFSIKELHYDFLQLHFKRWKGAVKGDWSLCHYPFLLEATAKTALLGINSREKRHQDQSNCLFLAVERDKILKSTRVLEQCEDVKRPLTIRFAGEKGVDDGALRKEYFMLVFEEILNNERYGLFDENEISHLLWFPKNDDRTALHLYTLIGKLCGIALYNGVIVNFNLPLALYKELFNEQPDLDDFVEIDPLCGNSLKQILEFTEEDGLTVEDTFCLYFTAPGLEQTPLVKGGEDIPVTAQNREDYVRHYLEYFFHESIQSKLDAFRSGFFEAFDKDMLMIFRPEELMEMVTGYEDYDWKVLENATSYRPINCPSGGFDKLHPVIKWFWEILHSMSKEEKNKFLIFLTGSNKIPIVGLHMTIKQRQECDKFLPTAEVCYNALHLHSYSSKKILEERLRRSMQCKGFHLV